MVIVSVDCRGQLSRRHVDERSKTGLDTENQLLIFGLVTDRASEDRRHLSA